MLPARPLLTRNPVTLLPGTLPVTLRPEVLPGIRLPAVLPVTPCQTVLFRPPPAQATVLPAILPNPIFLSPAATHLPTLPP